MSDNKLRCVVVIRRDWKGSTVIAKYDFAKKEEHTSGPGLQLYGDPEEDFADAIEEVIEKDPPGSGGYCFGRFQKYRSVGHQLVYGADEAGICKSTPSIAMMY